VDQAEDEKRLLIDPEPSPRSLTISDSHTPFDTHSVDLKLGDEIVVSQQGQITYDLTKPGKIADTIQQHSRTFTISQNQPFCLKPKQVCAG
jgi:hypothetical protein